MESAGTIATAGPALASSEGTGAPASPDTGWPESDLWRDPSFRKSFLGSYGFQAELEPRLTQPERDQLAKVMPLMGTDLGAAAAALEPLCKPEASAVFDFTLGNIDFQQDRLEAAAARYEAAIAKFPSFRRAWRNLGIVQVRLGRFDQAVRSLGRVIELGGGEAITYGLLGYAYTSVGQPVSAESAYRNAALLQPDVLDWKVGLAQSALKQQKFGEAAVLCDDLITKHPDRSEYWLLQAAAYIGQDQPLKAAGNYEMVRRMGRGTPAMLWTLGDIYVNQGLWGPALLAYSQAMDSEPAQGVQRPLRAAEALAQRAAYPQARQLLAKIKDSDGASLDPADRRRILRLEAQVASADGDGKGPPPSWRRWWRSILWTARPCSFSASTTPGTASRTAPSSTTSARRGSRPSRRRRGSGTRSSWSPARATARPSPCSSGPRRSGRARTSPATWSRSSASRARSADRQISAAHRRPRVAGATVPSSGPGRPEP